MNNPIKNPHTLPERLEILIKEGIETTASTEEFITVLTKKIIEFVELEVRHR